MEKEKRQLRTKVISLKVTQRDYSILERYADSKGLSVSMLCYLFVKHELADAVSDHTPLNMPLYQGVLHNL
jgi:hypothetical protein